MFWKLFILKYTQNNICSFKTSEISLNSYLLTCYNDRRLILTTDINKKTCNINRVVICMPLQNALGVCMCVSVRACYYTQIMTFVRKNKCYRLT